MIKSKLFFINIFFSTIAFGLLHSNDQDFLVQHVIKSIQNAELYNSKLSEEVLNLQGMSSDKVRHFLNNICSLPGGNYLEIGVWQGSTFVSGLYKNNLNSAIAIDNWSEFGGPKNEFQRNLSKFVGNSNYVFYESDCFNFDVNKIKNKINIYFYDGRHQYEDQRLALTYYDSIFEDVFIVIIDDYNWTEVQGGTQAAFKELNYNVIYENFLQSSSNPLPNQRETKSWWNGIYVAVVAKS